MQQRPPDLVLLDVMMPDMDGFEVVRRIRQGSFGSRKANRRLRGVPIILITAYDEQTIEYGWKLGANDFIRKPIDFDQLLHRIRVCLPFINSVA
jgi:CheY-like chemotaxis protein